MADDEQSEQRVRLGRVLLRGAKLKENVTSAVTDASLTWSVTEVTQLSMTINDPGFVIWRTDWFQRGTTVVYREPGMPELRLRIKALALDGGAQGTGGFTVSARSEGVALLQRRRGPRVMRKASPTEFVKSECKQVGLKYVVQPSPQRRQVARDVPKKGEEDLSGASKPSSWTTFQRLATELGYYCYEFAGTVYFGKPTWLIKQDKTPMKIALPLPGAPEKFMARDIPAIDVSDDAEVPVEISGLLVERDRLFECTPGAGLELKGLPPFNDTYLITSVSMPLLGNGPLDLSAQTPQNPKPQPPAKPPSSGGGAGAYDEQTTEGAMTQTGSRSALDFVAMAITASGASYSYGAEASVGDASPGALDCSELIQWALGRVGVPFVDGSASQIGASNKISVQQAFATRGALLYKTGHIGISLGDGRSMEARNPSDGVGIFRAADIAWTIGGLVPGLRYG